MLNLKEKKIQCHLRASEVNTVDTLLQRTKDMEIWNNARSYAVHKQGMFTVLNLFWKCAHYSFVPYVQLRFFFSESNTLEHQVVCFWFTHFPSFFWIPFTAGLNHAWISCILDGGVQPLFQNITLYYHFMFLILEPEVDFMKREITAAFVSWGMHATESRLLD